VEAAPLIQQHALGAFEDDGALPQELSEIAVPGERQPLPDGAVDVGDVVWGRPLRADGETVAELAELSKERPWACDVADARSVPGPAMSPTRGASSGYARA
jgi:hypothetical protein